MPKPRYSQISLDATPYYHCVSRCVRRAFLCGTDTLTGQSYEHRQQWIEDKLLELGAVFALDICAYAVMSNHYHIVFHVDTSLAEEWTFDDVINHWHQLFSGNRLSQSYQRGNTIGKAELNTLNKIVTLWRARLMDISWFMRVLNESIARRANAEDDCTGRFWEGRFKSQALLDEAALLTCMAYVDLNPVRANMANTLDASTHTSIQQRIARAKNAFQPNHRQQQPQELLAFVGYPIKDMPKGLPFRLMDYLELVDATGRILRDNKRGYIDLQSSPVLQHLNMPAGNWLYLSRHFESPFKGLVGSVVKLRQACKSLGYLRPPGLRSCANYFP